jgi:hypothetical protein
MHWYRRWLRTEIVHGRARAPSRQTLRVAANEIRSRVPQLMGPPRFILSDSPRLCLRQGGLRASRDLEGEIRVFSQDTTCRPAILGGNGGQGPAEMPGAG